MDVLFYKITHSKGPFIVFRPDAPCCFDNDLDHFTEIARTVYNSRRLEVLRNGSVGESRLFAIPQCKAPLGSKNLDSTKASKPKFAMRC